ncbi:MAG: HU family DNA-binding protein, partial [Muribaculaceae bacterium]|nr:HU family DNA-binding protein [Muribaculaceae bacterium]
QFETKKRKERLTVHPATGRRLLVPPKLVVNFKPSGVMKSNLQNTNGQ